MSQLVHNLYNNFRLRMDFMADKIRMLGFLSFVGFPVGYYWCVFVYQENYDNLMLRLVMMLGSIPLLLPQAMVRSSDHRPLMLSYMYAYMVTVLAFPVFMFLKNPDSLVWAASGAIFVVAICFFLDAINLLIAYVLSIVLAYIMYFASGGTDVMPGSSLFIFAIQNGIIAIVASLTYGKQEIEQQRKEGALESISFFAHEIRTPLTAIRGYTEAIYDNVQNEQHRKMLMNIIGSSDRLDSIIMEMFSYWRLENDSFSIENSEINLDEFVNYISSAAQIQASQKQIEFHLEVEEKAFSFFMGDINKLTQITTNLINNAIKFTREGEVRVVMSARRTTDGKGVFHFETRDTGVGIADNQIEKILRPYQKAESKESVYNDGIGLGLSIVNRYLNMMDSQLSIDSTPAEGSRFAFDIEVEALDKREVRRQVQHSYLGISALYCDDNMNNLHVFNALLGNYLGDIRTCSTPDEAIEACRNGHYDIVFVDLHMPEKDGYQTAREIREFNQEVTIAALSASEYAESNDKLAQAGINHFLRKPFSREGMMQFLSKQFGDTTYDVEKMNIEHAKQYYGLSERLLSVVVHGFLSLSEGKEGLLNAAVDGTDHHQALSYIHEITPFFIKMKMLRSAQYCEQIRTAEKLLDVREAVMALNAQIGFTRKECQALELLPVEPLRLN